MAKQQLDLDAAIAAYGKDERYRGYAHHNHAYWRWTHGSIALVQKNPIAFDPVQEYWYLTERRLLAAYFSQKLPRSYAPADALRNLVFRTFLHFDRAREDGRFGDPALATTQSGLWPRLCKPAMDVASELPDLSEYGQLKSVFGRQLTGASIGEDLAQYIEQASRKETLGKIERAFRRRLPWFPYMGLRRIEDLAHRQRFFWAYYLLLTSSNAYQLGGAMSFAPVIQNNPTNEIMSYVERWAAGETLHETGFTVEGKEEKRDRSHHAPVVELYGFLNLHRMPFSNSANFEPYRAYEEPGDASVFDRLERIGDEVRSYLEERSNLVTDFARRFRALAESPDRNPKYQIEGLRSPALRRRFPEEVDRLIGGRLLTELNGEALERAREFSDLEAATALFHLMLDAFVYTGKVIIDPPPPPPELPPPPEILTLPPSLANTANDALGYLRAGHHVLFAGPPGTGKTTLAQFVGHAWESGADSVAETLALDDAPMTTVGNSAWAPFHTIGGLLPDADNRFVTTKGIFIDPEYEESGEWRLRDGCLVLDEMNRADLDRCVGELYPLLSRSVTRVHPAGIPGVTTIRQSERFRLIATVNDATLDDVVFPISEGLARRFIRIELLGARSEELEDYFGETQGDAAERLQAAKALIDEFVTLCGDEDRLTSSEDGEHLPFGVGYFAPLKSWVHGDLKLSEQFSERDPADQAREILLTALTSAVRVRGMESLLAGLRTAGEEG